MAVEQREQNPDVNSYNPEVEPGEDPGVTDGRNEPVKDIERGSDDDAIPVPPDVGWTPPVEEPPGSDGPPMGDVDDSPKKIVS